jgi:transposase
MIDTTDIPRIFFYARPIDLRQGFAGLYAIALAHITDPIHGDLYLFLNQRRTLLKALRWDGSGLVLLSKRLGHGRFDDLFRHTDHHQRLTLTPKQFRLLLDGHTAMSPRQPEVARLQKDRESRTDPPSARHTPGRTGRPRRTP